MPRPAEPTTRNWKSSAGSSAARAAPTASTGATCGPRMWRWSSPMPPPAPTPPHWSARAGSPRLSPPSRPSDARCSRKRPESPVSTCAGRMPSRSCARPRPISPGSKTSWPGSTSKSPASAGRQGRRSATRPCLTRSAPPRRGWSMPAGATRPRQPMSPRLRPRPPRPASPRPRQRRGWHRRLRAPRPTRWPRLATPLPTAATMPAPTAIG
jgi:hypothetical protein